jgi:hypothetical protein
VADRVSRRRRHPYIGRWILGAGWYRKFHPAPRLAARDSIVVADFANTTGDPVFDETLRHRLSAQLEQSPCLNLLSDQRTGQTLALMRQPKNARLTNDVARPNHIPSLDTHHGVAPVLILFPNQCANGVLTPTRLDVHRCSLPKSPQCTGSHLSGSRI